MKYLKVLFTLSLIPLLYSCAGTEKPGINDAIYDEFHSLSQKGPEIPHLGEGAIPQGIVFHSADNKLYISNDMTGKKTSVISSISLNETEGDHGSTVVKIQEILTADKDFRRKLQWQEEEEQLSRLENMGNLFRLHGLERLSDTGVLKDHQHLEGLSHFKGHRGHAGGITISCDYLWISSGSKIYYTPLADLLRENSLIYGVGRELPVKGSFAAFSEDILWVGEYGKSWGRYSTKVSHHRRTPNGNKHHAWMAGYLLDSSGEEENPSEADFENPDYILSVPDEMQGVIITPEYIITSHSGGFENPSRLNIYTNPMNLEPDEEKKKKPPLWILDDRHLLKTLYCPPMMEGIALGQGRIYLLFESASEFFQGLPPIVTKHIMLIDIQDLILP